MIGEGSNVLNPDNLKQLIKQHQRTGSLRFKQSSSSSSSNNENENPLVYLLKCKQLEDDEQLASIHRQVKENESHSNDSRNRSNYSGEPFVSSRNDKKPLIECQANSMNIKQHCTTPNRTARNLRSISPLNAERTDHRTAQNSASQTASQNNSAILKASTSGNSTPSSAVFNRRNRISSTLPKSLTSTNSKPVCVNLFDNSNLNSLSFDTTDQASVSNRLSSSNQPSISSPINSCPNNTVASHSTSPTSNNSPNGPQLMGNKRGKLSNFLRSIMNRNSTSETQSQFDKRGNGLKRSDKSNVLINLRKNKKLLIKNTVFGCELNEYLKRTGRQIPLVLKSCCEFLEENGIIHGVYRLSGVNSNIQKLIKCFNADDSPDFDDELFLQDVHCVSSLLKLYFRELPNPLLTFEL